MPGLEDLYREIILDHYKNPRNRGELETPPATVAEGHNPLCGDEITVYVLIDDGRVSEVRTAGHAQLRLDQADQVFPRYLAFASFSTSSSSVCQA